MAEEKQINKKLAIIKKIIRWIRLLLLTALIVGALIFGAPWKVLVLFMIFLAAATILPKPARKWFRLSVAAVVVILIIWVFLPDNNEGWRPYTFDKELAALETKYAIPDSENAAIRYNKLLDSYDPNFFNYNFLFDEIGNVTKNEFWSESEYPQVAEWLKTLTKTINALLEASNLDKCHFTIAANTYNQASEPPRNFNELYSFWSYPKRARLLPMRSWGELLLRSANNDVTKGQINIALEKYAAMLQLGEHLRQQPILLDLLVGLSIQRTVYNQISKFLITGKAEEEHIMLTYALLQDINYDWDSDFKKVLEREKLMFRSLMCGMAYQTNPKGKVRFNQDPNSTLRNIIHTHPTDSGWTKATFPSRNVSNYIDRKLTKAETIFCWFFIPSTPQKAAQIIDGVYERLCAYPKPDFEWIKEPYGVRLSKLKTNYRCFVEMIAFIYNPGSDRIFDAYLETATQKRACQVILVLRRYKNKYGHWPKSLDEIKSFVEPEILVDPLNLTSFVYKPTEENFILYSKGKNNIDEG